MSDFCSSLTRFSRRETIEVNVGGVTMGGEAPIVSQSMTNVDTMDTKGCVTQIKKIREAGCRVIRLTTQGKREAENLKNISEECLKAGLDDVVLVADVHFTPSAAIAAAEYADKVRINPGNYKNDSGQFRELIEKCLDRGVALRIGVNHGSLARHIMEKYGDTPKGMVESAMEFLRECQKANFNSAVVSMKSSNVRVMVHAYRLLAIAMKKEEMRYPLHLGVTEAGDGADARIKSAAGIGALLTDGLGNTIRVSLTEPPENEIPVANAIISYFENREHDPENEDFVEDIVDESVYSPFEYRKRETKAVGNIGGDNKAILFGELNTRASQGLADMEVAVIGSITENPTFEWRAAVLNMQTKGDIRPVILYRRYAEDSLDELQIKAAADFGGMFIDGLADGIWIENEGNPAIREKDIEELGLSILQAARVRMSKTEYIACPGCGRTLFDIQSTLSKIKQRTSHLKELKIGVMGCIVNGPGEMADADYGYVGEGGGKITLYKGHNIVSRSIPQSEAVEALVELIKQNGDWREP